MDLLKILKARIDGLPDGAYIAGLRAVLLHGEVAARHLQRGQSNSDGTAFTDAIYRTNQAFEGSLKEAYRVLTGHDPAKVRPYDIEQHFQEHRKLRARVLEQLTLYRTRWRNPASHDYRLDFDENEALLAIVNVCAFAIMLIDQIAAHLLFQEAKKIATKTKVRTRTRQPLLDRIALLVEKFTAEFNKDESRKYSVRDSELAAALSGFFASVAPELNATTDVTLSPDLAHGPDMLITRGTDRAILEVKRTKPTTVNTQQAIEQVSYYMAASGIQQAIIYFYYSRNDGTIQRSTHHLSAMNGTILLLSTKPSD
jgi:hypothetical protein